MITRGFGYKTYYSRTDREIDFLDLHLHLGRMEIESNRYDLTRNEDDLNQIKMDLKLMAELAQSKERKTYHSTAELYTEVDKLKKIEDNKDKSEITGLATFLK